MHGGGEKRTIHSSRVTIWPTGSFSGRSLQDALPQADTPDIRTLKNQAEYGDCCSVRTETAGIIAQHL